MGRSCQGITMTKAVKCRVRRVHRRAPAFRARERARKARSRKSCNGRSWCETFHACKKGDRRHQFHSWVKGQGYRFYKGACAHSNGRYGRRHKFWRGNHSFGQCKARCDRMGRSCQGITMTKAVKCRGRALSNYYKRYAHHIRRAGHRARVARHHARRARELAVAKTDRERARKARVKASHFDEHAALHRIADRAREQARKARIKATKPRKPAGRGWRWSPTSHRWLRKPRRGHGWRWNGHRWAMTRAHKRRLAIARRMRHAAAKMRERAKKSSRSCHQDQHSEGPRGSLEGSQSPRQAHTREVSKEGRSLSPLDLVAEAPRQPSLVQIRSLRPRRRACAYGVP